LKERHGKGEAHAMPGNPFDEFYLANTQYLIAMVLGGISGIAGSSIVALNDKLETRQLIATILAGFSFGLSIPCVILAAYSYNPLISPFIGLVSGIMSIGLVAGTRKMGTEFATKPWAFIKAVFRQFATSTDEPKEPKPGSILPKSGQ
jgi:hypothetical protein